MHVGIVIQSNPTMHPALLTLLPPRMTSVVPTGTGDIIPINSNEASGKPHDGCHVYLVFHSGIRVDCCCIASKEYPLGLHVSTKATCVMTSPIPSSLNPQDLFRVNGLVAVVTGGHNGASISFHNLYQEYFTK